MQKKDVETLVEATVKTAIRQERRRIAQAILSTASQDGTPWSHIAQVLAQAIETQSVRR